MVNRELKHFIGIDEALRILGEIELPQREMEIRVEESDNFYSASDIVSRSDFPPFDRSAVDGYALRYEDSMSSSRTNPSLFTRVGYSGLTEPFEGKLGRGQCVEIVTGAAVPAGADAVVMVEDTEVSEDPEIKVFSSVRKFQNVSRKGEDLRKGMAIIESGERIRPWHIAALLEAGYEDINVKKPRVCVLSTGDELVKGKVKNTSQPMLLALLSEMGLEPIGMGNVDDRIEDVERIANSKDCDVYIITGGTGRSDKDVSSKFLENNGKLVFQGLRIKPARTTGFGLYREKPVFIISGLPVAALVSFENVIKVSLQKWYHLKPFRKERVSGILERSVVNTLGMRSYVRVKLIEQDGKIIVSPLRITGSGVIYSVIDADGFLVMDENLEGIEEGQTVEVERIR